VLDKKALAVRIGFKEIENTKSPKRCFITDAELEICVNTAIQHSKMKVELGLKKNQLTNESKVDLRYFEAYHYQK
jgi:hypothetical protein